MISHFKSRCNLFDNISFLILDSSLKTQIMENAARHLLHKITVCNLRVLLLRWGRIDVEKLDFKARKDEISDRFVLLCDSNGVSYQDIAELDLLQRITIPEKLTWDAYELKNGQKQHVQEREDIKIFKRTLIKSLCKMACYNIVMIDHGYHFWGRISQSEGTKASYFIYHPHSRYLLVNRQSSQLKKVLLGALCQCLKFKDCKLLSLNGKCPNSLAQILLGSKSVGEANLQSAHYRKRKLETNIHDSKYDLKQVKVENLKDLVDSHDENERAFGPHILPTLQNVSIDVAAEFALNKSQTKTIVNGKLCLKGRNVLEGLRSLVANNHAEAPLPTYLTNIPMFKRNSFKITDVK